MAGNETRAEANRSFFVYVTDQNTGIIRRVAIPADLQVGLEGRPAELQLFGRLSLANSTFNVGSGDRGYVNVSNDDTVVSVLTLATPPSGRISVRLPTSPRDGQLHLVKDASGTASSVPIDIIPDTNSLIDGEELQTLSDDYASMVLVWLSDGWYVFATANASSGGGVGASTSASYVTMTSEPGLSEERVLTVGTGLTKVDGGANGNVTLSVNDGVVATLTGSRFSGPVRAAGGLSGSLQQLDSGLSYLVAGTNITVTSQSNGQVIVSSTHAPFSLEMSTNPSSTAENGSNAKKVGGRSYDPADWSQLSSSSVIVFHMLLETTDPLNPASGSLFRYSGTGAPAVLATVVTTSSVMVEREIDVSSFFRPGQAAGVFTVTLNLTTGSTSDYATSTAAWLEFTP